MSNKPMRLKELAKEYDGEWVLLGEPIVKHKRTRKVLSGVVLAHSRDRGEVYETAIQLKPTQSAFLCFKEMPEGHVLVL